MNGKDLLDIMSQVDDDLILKTEIPPEKKDSPITAVPVRKAPVRRVYAGVAAGICAALIAVIGFAAWKTNGFGLLKKRTENTEVTNVPDTSGSDTELTTTPPDTTGYYTTSEEPLVTTLPPPTTEEPPVSTLPPDTSEEPTSSSNEIDPDQVLYAPDIKTGNVPDDFESPATDEIQMPASLEEEFSKPENRDKYFAVSINISHFACVDEYLSGFSEPPYIPPEELAQMFEDEIRSKVYEEMDRLVCMGYNVYLLPSSEPDTDPSYVYDGPGNKYRYHVYNGYTVSGYLTGEQLASFQTDPAYGYRFTWDTRETHIDKSEI